MNIGDPVIVRLEDGREVTALVSKLHEEEGVDPPPQLQINVMYLDGDDPPALVTLTNVVHMTRVPPGPHYREPDQSPNQ